MFSKESRDDFAFGNLDQWKIRHLYDRSPFTGKITLDQGLTFYGATTKKLIVGKV